MVYLAVFIFILFCVTVLAAVSDVRGLRIPNRYPALVLVLFVPGFLLAPEAFGPLWAHGLSLLVMFVVTYGMFAAGMIGGGDSKLAAALALWTGLAGLLPFILYMTMAGGVLGLVALLIRNKKPFAQPREGSWIDQLQKGRNAVPYGIAIVVGFWPALLQGSAVYKQLLEVF